MPINLFDLFGTPRRDAALAAGRDAERRAVRETQAAIGSRGVNPAAQAQALSAAREGQRAAMASRIAQATAEDRLARGRAASGLLGAGVSALGTIAGLGAASNVPAVAQQAAPAPLPSSVPTPRPRRPEEDPLGVLGPILGRTGRRLG